MTRIPPARSEDPWSEAASWVASYRATGRLDEREVQRLVESVEQMLREHRTVWDAVTQLERVWPNVRAALNDLHRTTARVGRRSMDGPRRRA